MTRSRRQNLNPHQVFPDEYHWKTLTMLLDAAGNLHENVNLQRTVAGIMDRLVRNARNSESSKVAEKRNIFGLFWDAITSMISVRTRCD